VHRPAAAAPPLARQTRFRDEVLYGAAAAGCANREPSQPQPSPRQSRWSRWPPTSYSFPGRRTAGGAHGDRRDHRPPLRLPGAARGQSRHQRPAESEPEQQPPVMLASVPPANTPKVPGRC
jgi:hypothetical protein